VDIAQVHGADGKGSGRVRFGRSVVWCAFVEEGGSAFDVGVGGYAGGGDGERSLEVDGDVIELSARV
jgi:hypothetical protein